jgi:phosphate transport system protein
MATTVMRMVRDSFDAFMDRDLKKAEEILKLDDAVDTFRNQMSNQLREKIKEPGMDLKSIMSLLSVVRNLERLADHATNIAEEIIFYLTGSDIRHPHIIKNDVTIQEKK